MTVALFAGRFDPVTNGHLDIVLRAARLFEEVVVGVEQSGNRAAGGGPATLFDTEERVGFFTEAARDLKNVEVKPFSGLTVEFARSQGATVLIRSMRGSTDFESEFDMALMNRKMAPEIESIYMISRLENLFIRGTSIREVAALGYDVSDFVPAHVAKALKKKFGRG
ncbi:MAG: pantetheine-phosphate adenylyltransferase [Dehalococcoidia bacterium]|nr:pantetheine-phosphate adenylyltransferase [Dehalococcoidia bacterium]